MAITRVWQTGFETGNAFETDGGLWGFSVATVYTGIRCASTECWAPLRYFIKVIPATRQIRLGVVFYVTLTMEGQGELITIRDDSLNSLVQLKYDPTDGSLDLYVGGVLRDSGSPGDIATGTHYFLAFDIKIDSSDGWVNFYKDFDLELSYEGNTGNANITSAAYGTYTDMGVTGAHFRWDDAYIDDTTGEVAAANPPQYRYYLLTPNGAGNYTQWTPSAGNNYQCVDEVPPSGSDFVQAITADKLDSYQMTTHTLLEAQLFNSLIPFICAQRYGTGQRVAVGTRYSGANVIGSDQDPDYGVDDFTYERQLTKPGGGNWTQAAVDAVELVIKSRGTY